MSHLNSLEVTRMGNLGKRFSKKVNNLALTGNFTTPNTMFSAFPDQILGGGFSSDMQMATFPCLNINNINFNGASASVIPFSNSIPFVQFLTQLIPSSVNNNLWMFSSNPEAIYAQYVNDTIYTQSFYFVESVILPTRIFIPNGSGTEILNPFGLGAYNVGPDQFRATCGDIVAVQEQLGASLFATMQITFDRLADKTTFNAQINSSFVNITDAYTAIQSITSQYNLNGNLEFVVFQSGGNATQLAESLSKNPITGNYYLMSCGLSTLSDCGGAILDILIYATYNFPNQVTFINDQIVGNAVSTGFIYENYTNLGLTVGDSVVTPSIQIARSEMIALYTSMQTQAIMVNKILSSDIAPYIEPVTSATLSSFTQANSFNMQLIANSLNGVTGCYLMPESCLNIVANINNQSMPLNTTLIEEIITEFQTGYSWNINDSGGSGIIAFLPIGNNVYRQGVTGLGPSAQYFLTLTRTIELNNSNLIFYTNPSLMTGVLDIVMNVVTESNIINLTYSGENEWQGTATSQLAGCLPGSPGEGSLTLIAVDSGIF